MVEDFSQIIPTRIPHPRGLFYFNAGCYGLWLHHLHNHGQQKKVQSVITSAVGLSCKAVLHVLTNQKYVFPTEYIYKVNMVVD